MSELGVLEENKTHESRIDRYRVGYLTMKRRRTPFSVWNWTLINALIVITLNSIIS